MYAYVHGGHSSSKIKSVVVFGTCKKQPNLKNNGTIQHRKWEFRLVKIQIDLFQFDIIVILCKLRLYFCTRKMQITYLLIRCRWAKQPLLIPMVNSTCNSWSTYKRFYKRHVIIVENQIKKSFLHWLALWRLRKVSDKEENQLLIYVKVKRFQVANYGRF